MTNRLVSNMYIIDSGSETVPLAYGNMVEGGSWELATTANIGKMRVMSVVFMANDTTARGVLALMSTENIVMDYNLIVNQSGGTLARTSVESFGYGVPWLGVLPIIVTACTMCLVLE